MRELAKRGCHVRAGCRDVNRASTTFEALPSDLRELVESVPYDATAWEPPRGAIGDASVVVSALGAPFSWGRVDGRGIAELVREAARGGGVEYVVVVSSLGVGRPWVLPAGLLNLAGGVLLFKDYSEGVLRTEGKRAGMGYLIVRPGGMERAGDDFGETHRVRLEGRNTLAKGVVSRLQVAQLVAEAVMRRGTLGAKTVEVVAETDAPLEELGVLLEKARLDEGWSGR